MSEDGVEHPHEACDSGGEVDFNFGLFFRLTVEFRDFHRPRSRVALLITRRGEGRARV